MQAIFDGSRNRCEIARKIYCMEIAVDMFFRKRRQSLIAPGIAGR
jgi:hypothetical protein